MANENIKLGLSLPFTVRVGRLWFQWRSFSPVPLFLMMVLLPANVQWSLSQRIMLIFGIILSEGLRLWSVGYAGSVTRTRSDSVKQLVHAGPYRFVRNPLYIANVGLYSLCSLMFGFTTLSYVVFFYSAIEYIFIVAFEEHILGESFGKVYQEYCGRVSRWIPSFSPRVASSEHVFSVKKAFRSERSTFLSIFAMIILYWLKQLL